MAKTLAQGRKPGSGRKPGKGKTLREGRKPGSGRRRRNGDEKELSGPLRPSSMDRTNFATHLKDQIGQQKDNLISSRDMEAVDALRELNNSPPQQQPLTPTPTPTHMELSSQLSSVKQQLVGAVPQKRSLSAHANLPFSSSSSNSAAFTFHNMNSYMMSPQYMHSAPLVSFNNQSQSVVQPISPNNSSADPASDNSSDADFSGHGNTSNNDSNGNVLIHTST